MSVDTFDIQQQAIRIRQGLQPGIFPIIIDATAMAIGAEVEVMLTPCDHIWMPTYFDPSLGLNPNQSQPNNFINPNGVASGPNQTRGVLPLGVGQNIFDVWYPQNNGYHQGATIFSLRFNSINAPWLLWGLSSLLSSDPTAKYLVGQGDCMRSITGPIARMWFRKIASAVINATVTPAADRIVLLSSLGYSQVTLGAAQPVWDSAATSQGQISTYATTGGGYATTQLNSLEQKELANLGLVPTASIVNGGTNE